MHITQIILFKVKNIFISTHVTSKQDLVFHYNLNSIAESHTHPNSICGIPLNWWIWFSIVDSIPYSILCIQTQHYWYLVGTENAMHACGSGIKMLT